MKSTDDETVRSDQNSQSYFGADNDAVEAYKQEFKRKRWEREKRDKEQRLNNYRRNFNIMRILTMPIVVFAVFLIVDSLWPASIYYEKGEQGWQKRYGKHGAIVSYMETRSFTMVVPAEIHLNYPYYYDEKELITIKASPFLKIPKSINLTIDKKEYHTNIGDTVYYLIPFHWLLFVSALFTVLRTKYSDLNYALSFLPILILCIIMLRMMPS